MRMNLDRKIFDLNGTNPFKVLVRETTPEGNATKLYTIVADYGWAEVLLATDCYLHIANDLAFVIGTFLNIPYEEIIDDKVDDG